MNDIFGIVDIIFPVEPVVNKPTYTLSVKLKFNDTGIVETVNFQSLNVFKFIENDVEIILWKHIRDDGEVMSEGTSIDTFETHLKNFKEE